MSGSTAASVAAEHEREARLAGKELSKHAAAPRALEPLGLKRHCIGGMPRNASGSGISTRIQGGTRMPAASPLSKLLGRVDKFVTQHDGHWNHSDWEQLVEEARAMGFPFDDDECKRNLGNILEASKYFYERGAQASAPAKKASAKAPAKKKAAS
jgi:hypothetical protein